MSIHAWFVAGCLAGLLAAALALPSLGQEPKTAVDVRISGPKDYQVFQRSSRDEGTVFLNGQVSARVEKLQGRFVGKSASGPLPGKWFDIRYGASTWAFNVARTVPSGGWYRLEFRAINGRDVVAQAAVEHVGVGEVFVTAGQSNSTSCGQFPIQQFSGMVASFDGAKWQLSKDPQPGAHDMHVLPNEPVFFGGSPWPAFGDAMYARYKVPIGVATTGHGGSSVNAWQPGGELFNWTLTRIRQIGRNGFRAVLWHQGESDVSSTSEEYYRKLAAVIEASNKKAGWEFPWFVAQVSYCSPKDPSFETTRSAQEKLWKDGVALQGPDTDTLGGDNRDYDGNGIHFSPKGLKAHGEMWAVCVGKYLDKILGK